jgi:hypothetical protein
VLDHRGRQSRPRTEPVTRGTGTTSIASSLATPEDVAITSPFLAEVAGDAQGSQSIGKKRLWKSSMVLLL